uniref:Uncharacterized protein n=1 Tax=Trieres chinensis TaxID=1514140 RepID=A0A7S2A575_TRICV|mmetsp:Transcript_39980/g.81653  ORF Transcript_39980/g.81653 Transcript_39980/m.81653 type:complete len:141 (+) Transcript_39980:65-487(+)|eukprot:CAMPEP_0183296546 /NCGR_PEP_ID=MMETSP0160_2-20130417/4049_1 /TAXON_ID=2839 ORGANISM="Odontella Sinensis, Strain Grunow 1884" /NCGR_SAMPLE_ID=MMETSP0160_2 /ASSEMBLY_ACC=CAM_ASM_000250 /LENGTH=140 /DNA_ID=CAMNT_0025458165 /DNA_START=62 /DNA_END=484 /DNA_ORIENTATION=-
MSATSAAGGTSFLEKMKAAGKTIVDSGAKTMLKTDIVFLEREIKSRKQRFGVEVYELMEQLEVDTGMSIEEKETKIRLAFDRARKDIAVVQAKIECKREEMTQLELNSEGGGGCGVNTTLADGSGISGLDATEMEHGITE